MRHRSLWREGAVAGVVGGIFYTLLVEAVTIVASGPEAFFQPLRQIGAVVLGPRALDPGFDLTSAVAAGVTLHLAISAAFGILVALIAGRLPGLTIVRSSIVGSAAGLILYAIDLFVIFPAAFPWFLANDRVVQSIAHAVFGAVTGMWLARRGPA